MISVYERAYDMNITFYVFETILRFAERMVSSVCVVKGEASACASAAER